MVQHSLSFIYVLFDVSGGAVFWDHHFQDFVSLQTGFFCSPIFNVQCV